MTSVFPLSNIDFARWLLLSMMATTPEVEDDADHADRSSADADHFLMARLRSGDESAFGDLFNKWKQPLISFFYRSLGDYHLSEDLTLEVATKVYRAKDRYEPRALFSTWLFQIARNCLLDSARKKRLEIRSDTDDSMPGWDYPENKAADDDEQIRLWEEWLATALQTLPESEKSALLLVAQQGMKPSEAAEVMQVKPNHLRVLLNKARNRLRDMREEVI